MYSTNKQCKYTENTMEATRRAENNSLCENGSRGRRGGKNGSSCASLARAAVSHQRLRVFPPAWQRRQT